MNQAAYPLPFNGNHRPSPFRAGARIPLGWPQHFDKSAATELVLNTALAFGTVSTLDDRFDSAVALYEAGHWEQAFEALATLADRLGHARAAKLALLMLRYGASLYGTTFAATPQQVASWAQRVLRASSRATASPRSMTAIA